jgi:hypothetical protein
MEGKTVNNFIIQAIASEKIMEGVELYTHRERKKGTDENEIYRNLQPLFMPHKDYNESLILLKGLLDGQEEEKI